VNLKFFVVLNINKEDIQGNAKIRRDVHVG